jgi:integrase
MAGHVRKRRLSDGRVSYQARLPTSSRPRKVIVKTFARRRDAERWLTGQAAAIHDGSFIDPRHGAKPFRDLITTWERTHLPKLAPKSRERYESVTRTYLIPRFGATPLGKLTRAEFKEWFANLAAERKPNGKPRYAPGTLRKVQVILSSILSEGIELGLLRENPAARLRLPSPPRTEMTILTADEIKALADAIPRTSDRLAIYVAAYCGLRAGELWALQRRDIDLLHNRLYVRRALKDIRGHLEFGDTKTTGSRRTVSLPTFLGTMLAEHMETMPASADALLFVSPGGGGTRQAGEGGPIRHGLFVRRVFKPAIVGNEDNEDETKRRKPALPAEKHNLRFHDLRHTCASLLIAAGAHPKLIQARLGHASITTTLDRYGHLFPSVEAALADALDATFNGARTSTPLRQVKS